MTPNYPNQSSQTPLEPTEVHLHDYLRVILRRRWSFITVFCAVFIGVAIYTYTVKPTYEAFATLHVHDEKSGKGDLLGDLGISGQNTVDAEIEIVKSRTNLEQVSKRLHLNWVVSEKSEGLDFKLLEFQAPESQSDYQVEVTGPDSYRVLDAADGVIGNGKSGLPMRSQSGTVSLLLTDLKGKTGDGFRISMRPLDVAAAGLKDNIKAAEVGKKTGIFRLSYTDTDPVMARDVVNILAQVYLEQSVAFKTEEASKSLDFIEGQMKAVQSELDSAEKNLQAYKTGSGVVKLDSEADELVRKISETEKERAGITIQRKQLEFALAAVRDAVRRGKIYTPAALNGDPGVAAMAAKLADLEVQKQAVLVETTESHPQVIALKSQISEIQRKLAAIYDTSQKNLGRQEAVVAQTLAGYEGQLKRLPMAERDLARLMRYTKVNADIYTFLLQKHEESRIAKAATISNINVIDQAITPRAPIKPVKLKNLLLGLLVGLMLGAGVAFFQEYLDDTIKDAEGARRELNAPVLAVIPFIPRRQGQASLSYGTSLITQHEPKSSAAEAFRSLRTSIHFSAINREKKTLIVTSTFPGEGKTTISANLAVILAQAGARVLLIDCDLRRPKLHEHFNHSKTPGLTEVLAGDASFASALHNTGIARLDFVGAGTSPPNPAELLGSNRMANLLQKLRDTYDHIVLDAPPVLAVTDAPLLTTRSDMAIIVMETERVPVKAAQRMAELLVNVQAPVAGIIVNDKSGRSFERYGYYGDSYYGYGYYGAGYYAEEGEAKHRKPWWRKFFPNIG